MGLGSRVLVLLSTPRTALPHPPIEPPLSYSSRFMKILDMVSISSDLFDSVYLIPSLHFIFLYFYYTSLFS